MNLAVFLQKILSAALLQELWNTSLSTFDRETFTKTNSHVLTYLAFLYISLRVLYKVIEIIIGVMHFFRQAQWFHYDHNPESKDLLSFLMVGINLSMNGLNIIN